MVALAHHRYWNWLAWRGIALKFIFSHKHIQRLDAFCQANAQLKVKSITCFFSSVFRLLHYYYLVFIHSCVIIVIYYCIYVDDEVVIYLAQVICKHSLWILYDGKLWLLWQQRSAPLHSRAHTHKHSFQGNAMSIFFSWIVHFYIPLIVACTQLFFHNCNVQCTPKQNTNRMQKGITISVKRKERNMQNCGHYNLNMNYTTFFTHTHFLQK